MSYANDSFSIQAIDTDTESSILDYSINCVDETYRSSYEDVEFMESALGQIILFADVAIGKGTFGIVFEGMLNDEYVAVKISKSSAEASWKRETDIYNISKLRHPGILSFIGSVMVCDELLLVTEYHPKGSLHDYLKDNTIDVQRLLHYSLCVGCGLHHLHTNMQGKPAIAHRDLNTENILMKLDGSCCIADFGFALSEDKLLNTHNLSSKVGTSRYMAPEIFDDSLDMGSFESFLKTDIYALSLVYWELCRRTISSDKDVDNFNLPYEDFVADIPNDKEMREALSVKKVRPLMSPRCKNEHVINEIMKVAVKCWEQYPGDRPSMYQVGELLGTLAQKIYLPSQNLENSKPNL